MNELIWPLTLPVADELRLLLENFDCVADGETDDVIAQEVNGFLRDGAFEDGLAKGISTTYVVFDDPQKPQKLLGYVAIAIDSVRLSSGEKNRLFDGAPIADFGAVRIVMIGIDREAAGQGLGSSLLDAVNGIARKISKHAALRFVVADANVRYHDWYERRGFVLNRSQVETDRGSEWTVSMRFDLRTSAELAGEVT